MVNEETTNELIRTLLKEAKITPTAQGTNDKIIAKTLKDASKKDTGKKGAPDLVAFSNSFPLIFENKKDIKDQAEYLNESKTKLKEDTTSKGQYAENGALHYAKHIVNHKDNPSYEEVFAFGCSGDKDNYIIRPIFVNKEGYKLLPYIYNFENFKEDNIEKYYKEQVLGETPPEILELEEIIKKAKELNACMREEGSLGKKEKSLVVSAILLALNNNENIRYELQGKDNPKDGENYIMKLLTV